MSGGEACRIGSISLLLPRFADADGQIPKQQNLGSFSQVESWYTSRLINIRLVPESATSQLGKLVVEQEIGYKACTRPRYNTEDKTWLEFAPMFGLKTHRN